MREIETCHSKAKTATRRSLIASVAVLGVWGVTSAVIGAQSASVGQDVTYHGGITYDPTEDDNLVLTEASMVRPARAVPQGELAVVTSDASSDDVMGVAGFAGTVRLRVTGSWLYETGEAFEQTEGISLENNYADKQREKNYEKSKAYDEAHPEVAKNEANNLKEQIGEGVFGFEPSRVDDLTVDYNKLLRIEYDENWERVPYAITTRVLLDSGYKLITYDLEIENVDAQNIFMGNGTNPDLLQLPSLARGSDVAVWQTLYYLAQGENEPSADTLSDATTWDRVLVPQGEKRLVHVVMAVSPRTLKGELSLFMGVPLWQPTIPDNVVLLALDPQAVS